MNNKLAQELDFRFACRDAIKWVKRNNYSPIQAWEKCNRPDWLFWVLGKLSHIPYYEGPATSAALSACIDVMLEHPRYNRLLSVQQYNYMVHLSTALDKQAQGQKFGVPFLPNPFLLKLKRTPWDTFKAFGYARLVASSDPDYYSSSAAYRAAMELDKFFNPNELSWHFGKKPPVDRGLARALCKEIRRVVVRPTFKELQGA